MNFTDYCFENNIKLLHDDLKFLRKMLYGLDERQGQPLLMKYCEEWLLGMEDESIVSLKSNMGRKRANLWLLNQVRKKK